MINNFDGGKTKVFAEKDDTSGSGEAGCRIVDNPPKLPNPNPPVTDAPNCSEITFYSECYYKGDQYVVTEDD